MIETVAGLHDLVQDSTSVASGSIRPARAICVASFDGIEMENETLRTFF